MPTPPAATTGARNSTASGPSIAWWAAELFGGETHRAVFAVDALFDQITRFIEFNNATNFRYIYDQIVCVGELVSTTLVAQWLNDRGLVTTWLDAREVIRTDHTYTDAHVDWTVTRQRIRAHMEAEPNDIVLTQGFIGSTEERISTTLGREGSDFTAAIFAACLAADRGHNLEGRGRGLQRRPQPGGRCRPDARGELPRSRRDDVLRRQGHPSAHHPPPAERRHRVARALVQARRCTGDGHRTGRPARRLSTRHRAQARPATHRLLDPRPLLHHRGPADRDLHGLRPPLGAHQHAAGHVR